jgi:hypothetical protein
MSSIYVNDIWAEDLFEWFYNHVRSSGGDGAGAIVCKNYKDTANWFIEWWQTKMRPTYKDSRIDKLEFWHPRFENDNSIHYHDDNEDFIFTDSVWINLHHGDYIMFVTKDCSFGFEKSNPDKVIKSIKTDVPYEIK